MEQSSVQLNFTVDPWKIVENQFRCEANEVSESVFSLANEYMGCRGNFEEGFSGTTLPGSYIGGIFIKERQSYVWKRRAFPTYSNTMINTTNWLAIRVEVDDEAFDMGVSEYCDYLRELDLKAGTLSRELVFTTKMGDQTGLRWERFVSHADRHLGAVRLSVKAINHQKKVRISFLLDSSKENRDFDNSIIHCEALFKKSDTNGLALLMKVKSTGQYYIHRMHVATGGINGKEEYSTAERSINYSITFMPQTGKQYDFDKLVSVWTSREMGYPYGLIAKENETFAVDSEKESEIVCELLARSKEHLGTCKALGFDRLRKQHTTKIAEIWDKLDIEIYGDDAAQQGIRYCMFQLFSTYLGNDGYLNIGAKGYTGECYNGRTFWDSESYCLPFYLFTNPAAAKNLIEYRYNTLDAARARAKEFGYDGAIYPMTTIDGTEDCSVWEYAFGEIHINAIIVYAVFLYTHINKDTAYLYTKGIEVLIEVSRFWASRATFIPYRNGYAINRVMGPDEYQMMVNNNFYTNYMAKWVLEYTVETIAKMREEVPGEFEKISEKIQLDSVEPQVWLDIASKMILNYNSEMDIFVQDDMFFSLDPICREDLDRERDIPIERKWTIEKIQKCQIIKQADVLLAMFLFRDKFTREQKINNYRFYEQRTLHGSSLSPCIHSILACEVGRYKHAYSYYMWASRLDLDNFNNNTQEGLHISSMAGTWMNIVCGFGGMIYTGDKLEFSPLLPKGWQGYSFRLEYHGSTIRLMVDREKVCYQIIAGGNVKLRINGYDVEATKVKQTVPTDHHATMGHKLEAILFDLDGVIVDTAKYHYLAWKEIADSEDIYFDEHINLRLRGVSRMESLNILLERSRRPYSEKAKETLAQRKNSIYCDLLKRLTSGDILPGISELLKEARSQGIKTAVVSVSKNAAYILEALGIEKSFDIVITGHDVIKSKPDPECFVLAAQKLNVPVHNCVVVEDAIAGIEAASRAGMKSIGIGDKTLLFKADYALTTPKKLDLDILQALY